MKHEIFALKYATRPGLRSSHFIGDHDNGSMPMDYYVWVVRSPHKVFVVDTGFTEEQAHRLKRTHLRSPIDTLRWLGVDPDVVGDVILTHLHYDHAGNCDKFPKARFHVQDREVAHATGRYMSVGCLGHGYFCDDVLTLVRLNYRGQVTFHDSTCQLEDGISLHLIGGHTPGLQCVRVDTGNGIVVLASDAAHYYEQLEMGKPFSTVSSVIEMLEGYATLRRLAGGSGEIIPGHDPLVMRRYPAVNEALSGVAVRIA